METRIVILAKNNKYSTKIIFYPNALNGAFNKKQSPEKLAKKIVHRLLHLNKIIIDPENSTPYFIPRIIKKNNGKIDGVLLQDRLENFRDIDISESESHATLEISHDDHTKLQYSTAIYKYISELEDLKNNEAESFVNKTEGGEIHLPEIPQPQLIESPKTLDEIKNLFKQSYDNYAKHIGHIVTDLKNQIETIESKKSELNALLKKSLPDHLETSIRSQIQFLTSAKTKRENLQNGLKRSIDSVFLNLTNYTKYKQQETKLLYIKEMIAWGNRVAAQKYYKDNIQNKKLKKEDRDKKISQFNKDFLLISIDPDTGEMSSHDDLHHYCTDTGTTLKMLQKDMQSILIKAYEHNTNKRHNPQKAEKIIDQFKIVDSILKQHDKTYDAKIKTYQTSPYYELELSQTILDVETNYLQALRDTKTEADQALEDFKTGKQLDQIETRETIKSYETEMIAIKDAFERLKVNISTHDANLKSQLETMEALHKKVETLTLTVSTLISSLNQGCNEIDKLLKQLPTDDDTSKQSSVELITIRNKIIELNETFTCINDYAEQPDQAKLNDLNQFEATLSEIGKKISREKTSVESSITQFQAGLQGELDAHFKYYVKPDQDQVDELIAYGKLKHLPLHIKNMSTENNINFFSKEYPNGFSKQDVESYIKKQLAALKQPEPVKVEHHKKSKIKTKKKEDTHPVEPPPRQSQLTTKNLREHDRRSQNIIIIPQDRQRPVKIQHEKKPSFLKRHWKKILVGALIGIGVCAIAATGVGGIALLAGGAITIGGVAISSGGVIGGLTTLGGLVTGGLATGTTATLVGGATIVVGTTLTTAGCGAVAGAVQDCCTPSKKNRRPEEKPLLQDNLSDTSGSHSEYSMPTNIIQQSSNNTPPPSPTGSPRSGEEQSSPTESPRSGEGQPSPTESPRSSHEQTTEDLDHVEELLKGVDENIRLGSSPELPSLRANKAILHQPKNTAYTSGGRRLETHHEDEQQAKKIWMKK